MPGTGLESTCDRNGLGEGRVPMHVVFSRLRDLTICHKIRLFKLFQHNRDQRIIQDLSISLTKGLSQFRHGLAGNLDVPYAPQGYKAVRLHRDGLVELGTELKRQVENVTSFDPVTRT